MSSPEPNGFAYMKTVPYSIAMGTLKYLVVPCRPDIPYTVSVFSRINANPSRIHWDGVNGIFNNI